VIIDKNAEHWGKLETPEWEKWFDRKEIERYLGKHCRSVNSQFISYWEDVEPDGMFLAGSHRSRPSGREVLRPGLVGVYTEGQWQNRVIMH
jgi:hypothetical protein